MNKKYLFDKTNVIDLSKLYEDDDENIMFYWCNSCGEVNLPGDIGLVLRTEDELPPKIKSIFEHLECERSQQPRLNRFTGYRRGLRGNP